ncbi:hypothetical protein EDC39_11079 [Geothermobacter ehrlichii]|uniref:Minor curlin subunit n=1 Tax=Geothermobacter ehrlichii TaxID=213224 RepID=A0A5D3WHJ6_9BACT|nr:hypothetical protein [Geothermobacter ehrlichii]TYO97539.1 hypothetical protein EDC39_11079 [Geothermobacter ehrlichii]
MKAVIPVLLTLLLVATTAPAKEVRSDSTRLVDQALGGATGIIGINMAAGSNNVQGNMHALILGDSQGPSPVAAVEQRAAVDGHGDRTRALDLIGGAALGGASGLIGVNQTAGSSNTQANLATIEIGGGAPVSLADLESARGQPARHGSSAGESSADVIQGQALANSSGLVQISQSAGSGNSIRNSIGVSLTTMEIY